MFVLSSPSIVFCIDWLLGSCYTEFTNLQFFGFDWADELECGFRVNSDNRFVVRGYDGFYI